MLFGWGPAPTILCDWLAGCRPGVWQAQNWRVLMPDGFTFRCRNEGDAKAIRAEWVI